MKAKWFEGHGLMYYENEVNSLRQRLEFLQDELNALRDKDFHQDAYVGTLHDWIKSDSVWTLLRYGNKTCSIVGGEDDHYVDLYNLSEQLRLADQKDNESRIDDFHQKLP